MNGSFRLTGLFEFLVGIGALCAFIDRESVAGKAAIVNCEAISLFPFFEFVTESVVFEPIRALRNNLSSLKFASINTVLIK